VAVGVLIEKKKPEVENLVTRHKSHKKYFYNPMRHILKIVTNYYLSYETESYALAATKEILLFA
jgi:hypothetical protein